MANDKATTEALLIIKANIQDISAKIDTLEKEWSDYSKNSKNTFGPQGKSALEFNAKLELLKKGLKTVKKVWDKTLGATIQTAADFEKLQVRLEALYQDVDIAAEKFEMLKNAAKETPFRLKDIVEAQAQLKAFGFAGDDAITMAADLAAFMGEDIVFAANSMGRAFAGGAGAADILRERGVLTLIKMREGISDLKTLSLPEFRKALIETMQDPMLSIAGSAEKLMNTFRGSVSNMQDAFDILKNNIGQNLLPLMTKLVKTTENVVRATADMFAEDPEQNLRNRVLEINAYFESLLDVSTTETERTIILQKLNPLLEKYVGETVSATTSNEQLEVALANVNRRFEEQITIDIRKRALEEYSKAVSGNLTSLVEQRVELGKLNAIVNMSGETYDSAGAKIIENRIAIDRLNASLGNTANIEKRNEIIADTKKLEQDNIDLTNIRWTIRDKIPKQEKVVTKAQDEYNASLDRYFTAQKQANEITAQGLKLLSEPDLSQTGLTDEEIKKQLAAIKARFNAEIDAEKEKQELLSSGYQDEYSQLVKIREQREKIDISTPKGRDAYFNSLLAEHEILQKIESRNEALKDQESAKTEFIKKAKAQYEAQLDLQDAISGNYRDQYDEITKIDKAMSDLDLSDMEDQAKYIVLLFQKMGILKDIGAIQDKNNDKMNKTVDLAQQLSSAIYSSVSGAEDLGDAVVTMLKNIASQILQDLILYLIGLAITGGTGPAFKELVGSLSGLGSLIGSSVNAPGFDKATGSAGGVSLDKMIDMSETNALLRSISGQLATTPVVDDKRVGQAVYIMLEKYKRGRA